MAIIQSLAWATTPTFIGIVIVVLLSQLIIIYILISSKIREKKEIAEYRATHDIKEAEQKLENLKKEIEELRRQKLELIKNNTDDQQLRFVTSNLNATEGLLECYQKLYNYYYK